MIKFFVILCLFALTLAEICPPENEIGDRDVRAEVPLSGDVVPLHYEITLTPNFETNKFIVNTIIEVEITKEVNQIVLHANGFIIPEDSINITCKENIPINAHTITDSLLTIPLQKPLKVPVDETCKLEFKNLERTFSEDKSGFYLAKYTENGNEVTFATTQFQKYGARKAFPCFDEPRFKSRYVINLIRKGKYSTVSNEELKENKTLEQDTFQDIYQETKPMSSYLVAFMVFEYVPTAVNQAQRVFAERSAIVNGDGNFALEIGTEILSAMEKFTEYRYSWPKMDQVAIPDAYFDPGAMENWGLVTYRKTILVYPYNQQVTKGFQRTVEIIAHEFSHQWFGNLVTCASWQYTWLNEGFATYFQYFASAMINWDLRNIFVMDAVHGALKQDSVKTIVEMNNVAAPTIIVYQKAGSVIRMMSHIVTEELFQKSLSLYLYSNKYNATTPRELYQAFETVLENANKTKELLGDKTFTQIMTTWDSKPGYPVVDVTNDGEKLVLKQERFFTDNTTGDATLWTIPLNYVFDSDTDKNFNDTTATVWMTEVTMEVSHNFEGWVLLNKQQMGYYRVKYDDNNWDLLVNQLAQRDHTQIHPLNRAQLIDDAFAFAKIGKMNYTQALNILKYLPKEEEYVPIAVFLKAITDVNTKLTAKNGREDFQFYMKNVFSGSALNKVNMVEADTDTLEAEYLRIELINWLCKFGDEQCTKNALDMYNSEEAVSNNLQEPIYCGAMRVADQDTWNSLFDKLGSETNDLSRSRMINALGCSQNYDILAGYVEKIINSTNKIDVTSGLRSIINAGDYGVEFMLNYTTDNFNETFPNIKTIISDLAPKLTTKEQKDKITEYGTKNPTLVDDIKAATNTIQENIAWNEKYGETIKSWFVGFRDSIENSALISKSNLNVLFGSVLLVILTTYFKQ